MKTEIIKALADPITERHKWNDIRKHCVFALFSMIDPKTPTERAMDIEGFRERARLAYLNDHVLYAQVNCLIQAIWETLKS